MGQFSSLILLLLLIAFLFRVDFIFYVVYICLGIYAWSIWYPRLTLKRVLVSRQYADHAFWGELVPVVIKVTNTSWLPIPWLQLNESLAPHLIMGKTLSRVMPLRSKERTNVTYEVKAGRRGYYQLGPLKITMGDLFGFVKEQQMMLPVDYLTVYPRITPLVRLGLTSRLPFGTVASKQRLFEDPARPTGVREFRSGDSIRRINWKVSAHTNSLLVKTQEPAISLEAALLLNLSVKDYHRRERTMDAEWAIEVAASLAAHLAEQRQAVGLVTNGVDPLLMSGSEGPQFDEASGRLLLLEPGSSFSPPSIPPRPGRANLMKILEQLARIEMADTTPFREWVSKACLNLNWGITVFAITAAGDEVSCHVLNRLVRAGYNPVLIAVEPDYNFHQVRERCRRLGYSAYNIASHRDLARWKQPLPIR